MASELPGGVRKKRKLSWQDDHSTDKIYASGDASVIANSCADTTLKPGQQPGPVRHQLPKQEDRSADKYYGNSVPPAPTKAQLARGKVRAVPVRARGRQASLKFHVQAASDVAEVVLDAIDALRQGAVPVVVHIKLGEPELLRRVRTALELAVTRETITETQFHDVRFSYDSGATSPAVAPLVPVAPVPPEALSLDDLLGPIVPAAGPSVRADEAPEREVDTTPQNIVEAPAEEDDDLFLDPAPVRQPPSGAMAGIGEAPSTMAGGMHIPDEMPSMSGVGDENKVVPKKQKPGRISGRGVKPKE